MFEIIENGNITSPKSYIAGGANVGIKTDIEELDFGILWSESLKTTCAGVFTKNSIVSHSVTASKLNLTKKNIRGVVANSGCANCAVGDQGCGGTGYVAQRTFGANNSTTPEQRRVVIDLRVLDVQHSILNTNCARALCEIICDLAVPEFQHC